MKTFTLLIILSISQVLFSQYGESNFLYTRIRLAEPSIGFEKKLFDHLGFAVEAGYRFRFTEEAFEPYGVLAYPFQLYWKHRAYSGISIRPFILNFYTSDNLTQSISTSYRFLSADNIIHDPGKFGGSNTSDYAEYAELKHAIGISYLYNKRLTWWSQASWYFELGVHCNFYKRFYSIEGFYSGQFASNKIEAGQSIGINTNFGLKIDFVRIW